MFPTRKLTESLTRLENLFFKLNYSVCVSLSDFLLCNSFMTQQSTREGHTGSMSRIQNS